MTGKHALLVSMSAYVDEQLSSLRATGVDGRSLDAILANKEIGDYQTELIEDVAYHLAAERIGAFLAHRAPSDTLLLYFSGHGVKNDYGELFLACTNSRLNQIEDTGLAASRISQAIERCRAKRILTILDCCYAGAYPIGHSPKASTKVDLGELAGDGRVVLASSTATEYSFAGQDLTEHSSGPSLFTGVLVDGLTTGDADIDRDGFVSVNDLFAYATRELLSKGTRQSPILHAAGLRGDMHIARSPVPRPVSSLAIEEPDRRDDTQEAQPAVISDALERFLDRVEAMSEMSAGDIPARTISSGLVALDEITGGFRQGDLVLMTAKPAVGKALLALGTARAAAIESDVPTLMVSLDLDEQETVLRLTAAEARIPISRLRNGQLDDEDWAKLARTMGKISNGYLRILDRLPAHPVTWLKSFLEQNPDIRLVVIDSLDLLTDSRAVGEYVELVEALHDLAARAHVAIVATINNSTQLHTGAGPLGLIRRSSDLVVLLERPELDDRDSPRPGEADLILIWNRRGSTRDALAIFQGHYARFVDVGPAP